MMPTSETTYSDPQVARSLDESVIEYDVRVGSMTAWAVLRIRRTDDGLAIHDRDAGPLHIPSSILPTLLAELDRLIGRDTDAPSAPKPAVEHITIVNSYLQPVAERAHDEQRRATERVASS